jgi:hypothetical protein
MNKFYLFSKKSCGPCALVDKYMNSIKDERTSLLEKVDLEDFSDTPIPQSISNPITSPLAKAIHCN